MQRWNDVIEIPADLGPTAVTLGNFDGVHRGHRVVLNELVARASERDLLPIAVTFDPHPIAVLRPEQAPEMLTSLDQRLRLVSQVGLHGILVMPFTLELAQWTPREFVERIFVEKFAAKLVVVGKDTRFGVKNSGDVDTLRELGREFGFDVIALEDVGVHGEDGPRWSSSLSRQLIAEGDVAGAAEVLGRPHRVSGVVVHGDHRGRDLGFPTANLSPDAEGLVPADGVYAGWLDRPTLDPEDPDSTLPAAISVGTNPTFDGTERRVEAYVLDRDDLDLYDEMVAVEFVKLLRPTLKFESIDELITQMHQDVRDCRVALSTMVPQSEGLSAQPE
ncbi:MAG: bifunctional riboflavin kinase/FAD synthetase [Dermatophilus congolensis]|nr:bifunctional riboflavin kinase/FAD synthetase [Dermatophilus congolensis]